MPREVTESFKLVVKTPSGNRMETSGKGGVHHGIVTAFRGMGPKRREWLIHNLTKSHAEMTAKEAERHAAAPATEGQG